MGQRGYVVGEVQTDEFTFVTNREIAPPRLEYITVQVQDPERKEPMKVLAQVTSLSVSSRLLDTSLGFAEVEAILNRLKSSPPIVQGTAKILGYIEVDENGKSTVKNPRHACMPGTPIFLAENDFLKEFFSANITDGIVIGSLINRENVPVLLNPDGLQRHLAVIAQTGAGKSYTVGVVLEQLLRLGGSIVVFDPNSDYVLMRKGIKNNRTDFADNVQVYRLPGEKQHRFSDDEIGGAKEFSLRFGELGVEEICALADIKMEWSNVVSAIRKAIARLKTKTYDFEPKDLLKELDTISKAVMDFSPPSRKLSSVVGDEGTTSAFIRKITREKAHLSEDTSEHLTSTEIGERNELDEAFPREDETRAEETSASEETEEITQKEIDAAPSAINRVYKLQKMNLWGYVNVKTDDILKPQTLSVIDLAGADQIVASFVVDKVLSDIWRKATTDGLTYPLFIVLEEAHNFIPQSKEVKSHCAYIIKRIASEGRKFGMFLTLITQRPYKVHQDTLSQCNSQIIMRLTNPQDQAAVGAAAESITQGLMSDLPGLNVGEAIIVGPIVRVPAMVRVRGRESRAGGNDWPVTEKLKLARSESITDAHEKKTREEKKSRGRSEWKEAV